MRDYKKPSHAVHCDTYHVAWISIYRDRVLGTAIKEMMERESRGINEWLGCEVTDLNAQEDDVHGASSIPNGPMLRRRANAQAGIRQAAQRQSHFLGGRRVRCCNPRRAISSSSVPRR